jgi:hypothetical protein
MKKELNENEQIIILMVKKKENEMKKLMDAKKL